MLSLSFSGFDPSGRIGGFAVMHTQPANRAGVLRYSFPAQGNTLRHGISAQPSSAAVFGLAELSSQSAHGGVSTFRKVRRYSQEAPNQPSRSSPPILATAPKSSQPAGQTFQQAIQVQTLAPCPSQDWPRHRPRKLANIRQDPAFGSSLAHNVAWEALATAAPSPKRRSGQFPPKDERNDNRRSIEPQTHHENRL